MPWKLEHKCHLGDDNSETDEFGVVKTQRYGGPVTLVMCERPGCKEQFYIIGHEFFKEAIPQQTDYPSLPPGFILPKMTKSS